MYPTTVTVTVTVLYMHAEMLEVTVHDIIVVSNFEPGEAWIGLVRQAAAGWSWRSGQTLQFTYWSEIPGDGDCAVVLFDGRWQARNCFGSILPNYCELLY